MAAPYRNGLSDAQQAFLKGRRNGNKEHKNFVGGIGTSIAITNIAITNIAITIIAITIIAITIIVTIGKIWGFVIVAIGIGAIVKNWDFIRFMIPNADINLHGKHVTVLGVPIHGEDNTKMEKVDIHTWYLKAKSKGVPIPVYIEKLIRFEKSRNGRGKCTYYCTRQRLGQRLGHKKKYAYVVNIVFPNDKYAITIAKYVAEIDGVHVQGFPRGACVVFIGDDTFEDSEFAHFAGFLDKFGNDHKKDSEKMGGKGAVKKLAIKYSGSMMICTAFEYDGHTYIVLSAKNSTKNRYTKAFFEVLMERFCNADPLEFLDALKRIIEEKLTLAFELVTDHDSLGHHGAKNFKGCRMPILITALMYPNAKSRVILGNEDVTSIAKMMGLPYARNYIPRKDTNMREFINALNDLRSSTDPTEVIACIRQHCGYDANSVDHLKDLNLVPEGLIIWVRDEDGERVIKFKFTRYTVVTMVIRHALSNVFVLPSFGVGAKNLLENKFIEPFLKNRIPAGKQYDHVRENWRMIIYNVFRKVAEMDVDKAKELIINVENRVFLNTVGSIIDDCINDASKATWSEEKALLKQYWSELPNKVPTVITILGPSGSGKTTLANLLADKLLELGFSVGHWCTDRFSKRDLHLIFKGLDYVIVDMCEPMHKYVMRVFDTKNGIVLSTIPEDYNHDNRDKRDKLVTKCIGRVEKRDPAGQKLLRHHDLKTIVPERLNKAVTAARKLSAISIADENSDLNDMLERSLVVVMSKKVPAVDVKQSELP